MSNRSTTRAALAVAAAPTLAAAARQRMLLVGRGGLPPRPFPLRAAAAWWLARPR
ncbi:hypothetical protein P1P75_19470 [Streptomyces sp. ID05-39B]|uniref:hypothetical protein n=1 Tax=Streptomyces sp. ID05-39B TaxID=3028664 RepID=UPI0029B9B9F5|nr:hypothetical protein [Streptomyces sp. ID05-39B]MDX3528566.1 hypothetical protein [Streptomyces sp. ID05-39B]